MTRIYGLSNGFGWKDGEVVGAQIISIPASISETVAQSAFRNLILYLAVVALITLAVLNLTLYVIVIRPVTKLSVLAESISRGNLDAEIPVQGSDEIAVLGISFNRVCISLSKAMHMLDGH
jgi:HAMP domain-containing protein